MKIHEVRNPGRKSEISREQILDAAAALFRDQGYAATSMRQISNAVKMKAGSIYYYFATKEDVLHAVLDVGERAVANSTKRYLKSAGPNACHRRRIECAIEGHLRALVEKSIYTSAYVRNYGQLPEEIKRRHRRRRNAYSRLWDGLFIEAKKAGEIRSNISVVSLRLFVLGALNWTVEWFDPNIHSLDELIRRTPVFIFDGIGIHGTSADAD